MLATTGVLSKLIFVRIYIYHQTRTIHPVFDPQSNPAPSSPASTRWKGGRGGRRKTYDRYYCLGQYKMAKQCKEAAYTKLQILLVREVEKLAILLVLNSKAFSASVLVRVVCHQKGCRAASKRRSYDDSDLCGNIVWRILAPESQRADNVSETWAAPVQLPLSEQCVPAKGWITTYKRTSKEPHSWSPSWYDRSSSRRNMSTTAASSPQ